MKPVWILGLLGAIAAWGEGSPSPSPFSRTPLRGELVTYFNLAVWLPGEEMVLVNHPRAGQLVPLQRNGELLPPITPFARDESNPSAASAMGRDLFGSFAIFRDAAGRMARELRFDGQAKVIQNESLEDWLAPSEGKLLSLTHTPVRFGSDIFAIAGVFIPPRTVRQGLVRFPAKPGAQLTWLREYKVDSVELQMVYSFPTLAATPRGVFFLDFSTEPPAVLELAPTSRRLASFPPGITCPPQAPPGLFGPDAHEAFMTGLEATAVPLGLFAAGEKLILLTRRPKANDGARWELYRLDPARDRLEGVLELPTEAPQLLIVPGDKRWLALELGPPGPPFRVRKLLSFLEFPASVLESPWAAVASSEPAGGRKP